MRRFLFISLLILTVVSFGGQINPSIKSKLVLVSKCGWLQNVIDYQHAGQIESVEPVPGLGQWLRLFIRHVSLPGIVFISSPETFEMSTPVWRVAVLVSNPSEWNAIPINELSSVENIEMPLLIQAVRPSPTINGVVFPTGAEARYDRLRFSFKWPLALPDDYVTFQTWVYLDEVAKGKHSTIVSRSGPPFYYTNSDKKGWYVHIDDGSATDLRVYVASGDGIGYVVLVSPLPVAIKRWTHVAVTIDRLRNEMVLYVNGIRVGEAALRLDTGGIDGFALGSFGGGAHALRGKLAWTSFFSPPLTDAQVTQLYLLQYVRLLCAEGLEIQ